MTDYLFGLQLSPPSSGRAICERAIALLFLPLCDFFGLNRRYATAVFFFSFTGPSYTFLGMRRPRDKHVIFVFVFDLLYLVNIRHIFLVITRLEGLDPRSHGVHSDYFSYDACHTGNTMPKRLPSCEVSKKRGSVFSQFEIL